MTTYKDVTSTLEGRLSLRNGKASRLENSDEDFFQSRPEPRPTVNSWISGSAIPDLSANKFGNLKSQYSASDIKSPRRSGLLSNNNRLLPGSHAAAPPQTSSDLEAFSLAITLAEPILYLEGYEFQHRAVHTSAVVRGYVQLNVSQKSSLSELFLSFDGISQTIWPESWRLRHLKKNYSESIIGHNWNFMNEDDSQRTDGKQASRQFEPGLYTYPFELPLDSALPETIHLPLGSVIYTLKATASRANNTQSTACSQEVILVRIPCSCSLETIEPCGAQGFQHGLRYNFMLHARSASVGSSIALGIRLMPSPDCAWQRLTISLEEDTRYRTRDGLAQREQSKVRAVLYDRRAAGQDDNLAQRAIRQLSAAGESMSSTYAGAANIEKPRRGSHGSHESLGEGCLLDKAVMKLPPCSLIHPDTAYSCIYVRHTLVITVVARLGPAEGNNKHFQIRVRMPIQLLTCKLAEGNTTLPEYVEAPESEILDTVPRLCRCSTSDTQHSRVSEIDETPHLDVDQADQRPDPRHPPDYTESMP